MDKILTSFDEGKKDDQTTRYFMLETAGRDGPPRRFASMRPASDIDASGMD